VILEYGQRVLDPSRTEAHWCKEDAEHQLSVANAANQTFKVRAALTVFAAVVLAELLSCW